MRNGSIHYTYKNLPCPNPLLTAQVIGCARMQITGGHVHLTLDYDGNCQSCLYLLSFLKEKSAPSLCIPSLLSSQLTAPNDVTGGLLPVKFDAPLLDTLFLEFSAGLSSVQAPRSLRPLYFSGFTF